MADKEYLSNDAMLVHMHDDLVRIEQAIDHGVAGIGLILGLLGPEYVTVHDTHVEIRIPRGLASVKS